MLPWTRARRSSRASSASIATRSSLPIAGSLPLTFGSSAVRGSAPGGTTRSSRSTSTPARCSLPCDSPRRRRCPTCPRQTASRSPRQMRPPFVQAVAELVRRIGRRSAPPLERALPAEPSAVGHQDQPEENWRGARLSDGTLTVRAESVPEMKLAIKQLRPSSATCGPSGARSSLGSAPSGRNTGAPLRTECRRCAAGERSAPSSVALRPSAGRSIVPTTMIVSVRWRPSATASTRTLPASMG